MGAVGATGWFTRGAWEGGFAFVSGLVLLVAGAALGIAGALSLGRNRTIFPEPLARGQLVRSGIYTHVRHPLYASVMLLSFAWALCLCSPAGLVAAALLSGFLLLKTGSEERRLLRRFPDYAGYRQQTKRFLPWIF
jgi:protein-S-isoprenylcysteine O-methyltransferase Ste14